MYVKGIGVSKDYQVAKQWFDKVYLNFAADPKASERTTKESIKAGMLIDGSPEWLVDQLLK